MNTDSTLNDSERLVSYNEETFELTFADGSTKIFRNKKTGKPFKPTSYLGKLRGKIVREDEKENGEKVVYFDF